MGASSSAVRQAAQDPSLTASSSTSPACASSPSTSSYDDNVSSSVRAGSVEDITLRLFELFPRESGAARDLVPIVAMYHGGQ
jgi:hypothetical protein